MIDVTGTIKVHGINFLHHGLSPLSKYYRTHIYRMASIILCIHPSTPQIDQITRSAMPSVQVVLTENDKIPLDALTPHVTRVGFMYDNRFPFIPFGNQESKKWFGQEFEDFIAQRPAAPLSIDLITCTLGDPLFVAEIERLHTQYPHIRIAYSTNQTGTGKRADWIMESDGQDIKGLYFDGQIEQWRHMLGGGGNTHSAIIRTGGTLWVCGANGMGQLGLGNTSNVQYFTKVSTISGARSVSCGGSHTAVVLAGGTVWTCGDNTDGQLGRDTSVTDSNLSFGQVTDVNGADSVCCGYLYTMVLLKAGTVWGCGINSNGARGNGTSAESTPYKWTFTQAVLKTGGNVETAVRVACGGNHTAILLATTGGVLMSGDNSFGQFGNGTKNSESSFKNVKSGVKSIACGGLHTAILLMNGSVQTAGDNQYGQLGLGGAGTTDTFTTASIPSTDGYAKEIVCGLYSTYALGTDNILYACGANYWGQLGIGTQDDMPLFTQCTNTPSDITRITAGGYHAMLLTLGGAVYATGDNTYDALSANTSSLDPNDRSLEFIASRDNLSNASIANGLYLWDTPPTFGLCMHPETIITTNRGDIMIKDIRKGDLVYSRDAQEIPVLANCMFTALTSEVVLICKDALGHNIPDRDTMFTAGHPVVVDGREIICGDLVNGTTIRLISLEKPVHIYTLCTRDRVTFMGSGLEIVTWKYDDFLGYTREHNVLYLSF